MSKLFRLVDKRTGELVFEGREATRSCPCPVCEPLHKRPSWCLVDPARRLSICPRVEGRRRIGDAGWLWSWDGSEIGQRVTFQRHEEDEGPPPDWSAILERGRRHPETPEKLEALAARWKLPRWCVEEIGTTWDGVGCYLFPMHGRDLEVTGMRVRGEHGSGRWSVDGSKAGLIVPASFRLGPRLFVTEGESDLAALLAIGITGVARPGCRQCSQILADMARGRELVIFRDDDRDGKENWGWKGATSLVERCAKVAKLAVAIAAPEGYKDLREWVNDRGAEVATAIDRKLRALTRNR